MCQLLLSVYNFTHVKNDNLSLVSVITCAWYQTSTLYSCHTDLPSTCVRIFTHTAELGVRVQHDTPGVKFLPGGGISGIAIVNLLSILHCVPAHMCVYFCTTSRFGHTCATLYWTTSIGFQNYLPLTRVANYAHLDDFSTRVSNFY